MNTSVLVAGLGGASLGTEVVKSLRSAGNYTIYGCDISPIAYGLYEADVERTFCIDKDRYIESVIRICIDHQISYIIPGGEQPMVLLAANHALLDEHNIVLAGNTTAVINLFSDKARTFEFLASAGFRVPVTIVVNTADDVEQVMSYPCIIKPSTGTGGSDSVFLATNKEECLLYTDLLIRNGRKVIVQEYIGEEEGEFTIGVLSDTAGELIGSIAMKRVFNSKLSVAYRGKKGLISSGYSQGLIQDFPHIRKQAEAMAKAADSRGPFNVQGRVRDGVLVPFEVNPRFSASTFLRTKAGFNEIDAYMQCLQGKAIRGEWFIQEGYYMRSFTETFIPLDTIKDNL